MKRRHYSDYMFTKSMLKERGWSDKLIHDHLTIETTSKNHIYARAAPIQWYLMKDVKRKEKTQYFQKAQINRKKRQEAARKAAETKRTKTMKHLDSFKRTIMLPNMSWVEVAQTAIHHRNEIQYGYANVKPSSWETLDSKTLLRWVNNFLRHECSYYDDSYHMFQNRVGKYEAIHTYVKMIYDQAKTKWPEYDKLCSDVIEKTKEVSAS